MQYNHSDYAGGVIYWNAKGREDTKLTIIGSKFLHNTAIVRGGAMMLESDFEFRKGNNGQLNEIAYNEATANDSSGGGIVITGYCGNGFPIKDVTNFDFNFNESVYLHHNIAANGAGVSLDLATFSLWEDFNKTASAKVVVDVTVDGASISDNIATGNGGGIRLYNNTKNTLPNHDIQVNIYLNDGSITNNQAACGGGIYSHMANVSHISGETGELIIRGNTATSQAGGGIYLNGGTSISLATTSITENSAVNGGARAINGDNASNLSITLGNSTISGNHVTNQGGAIYLPKGTLTIANPTISSNYAKTGGAIYIGGGSLISTGNARIQNNYSTEAGGAFYVTDGSVQVEDAIISGNGKSGSDVKTTDGGAIYVNGGDITLNGSSSISNNNAINRGGALYVNAGNILLNGATTINSNIAGHRGGAAYVINGSVSTAIGETTEISSNRVIGDNSDETYDSGGAFYIQGDSATKKGSLNLRGITTIDSNSAIHNGGAIALNYGDVVISGANTTISGNTALNGGAVYVYNGDFRNNNTSAVTTLMNNNCSGKGGAIYVSGGNFNTQGSIDIKGNYSSNLGGAIYVQDGLVSVNNPTITYNGKASGQAKTVDGGAIYITKTGDVNTGFNASGTVIINSNAARTNGGAVYVQGGNINITGSSSALTLSGNNAANGGAFYVNNGNIDAHEISNATITGNNTTADGGAFYVTGGEINLCETELSGNEAEQNGGAIALYNGTFSFADGSEIKNNTAVKYGGGLYISNASTTSITCVGGSYNSNTAELGGGIYAAGPIKLTFAANVEDNSATNGGGLYLADGVDMTFGYIDDKGTEISGLIVRNEATGTGTNGVGGGIYLAKGKLSFAATTNLGIYNNAASYEAADIFASGDNTTINLPYVKGLNLAGFDVPGSELYWVNDFHDDLGRYEAALRNINVNIQDMILVFAGNEITNKLKVLDKVKTCLDLGYDLVFVTFTPVNLANGDNAAIEIYYPDVRKYDANGEEIIAVSTPVMYRKLLLTGSTPQTIGLPSGYWYFDTTGWTYAYESNPVFSPTNSTDFTKTLSDKNDSTKKFIQVKRNQDQEITLTFDPIEDYQAVVKYSTMHVNKMRPGGSSTH